MLRFRRINRQNIVIYNGAELVFNHAKDAWIFIFSMRKDLQK